MADIELHQVSKEFPGGVVAVRDLSLSVGEGELVVLVGPSGCGKTTTLRLIAGLEKPTRGTIRIGGRVVNGLAPHRRDVAMVFQRPALYPHLSVRDNLAFGLRLRRSLSWFRRKHNPEVSLGKEVVEDRVIGAARMLGLEDLLDRRPNQLSGGQQQRVALGRAIVRRPAAFLLDEPLAGLDPPLRTEMRRELHLLHRRLSATIMGVTHDQVEAMALGDRVVVMKEGVVQQADRPQALYERPCNRFVAGFIGWPPMNFIDGRLVTRDGRLGFDAWGCWHPLPAERVRAWESFTARELTLGIRPEDVRISDRLEQPGVEMSVELVEPMGGTYLLTLRREDGQRTAQLHGLTQTAEVGQVVAVMWDMKQAYLFDRKTGAALAARGADG